MADIINLQQKKARTELVLTNIYNLPSVPKLMTEALKLLDNKNTSTSDLIKLISQDQGLVTKILTIANSPLYGLQRKVTSIDFAILILGFSELRNLISILSMIESFKNKTDKYLDQKSFWIHSYLTGSATKRLAEDFGFQNSGEAFVAGFLHDLGISAIHRYFHSNFVAIYDLVKEKGFSFYDAEMEILGMTHSQVGHYLLDRWNFPITLCNVTLNHHIPQKAGNDWLLASVISLADYMTQKLGVGDFYWDEGMLLSPEVMSTLRFSNAEELDTFIESFRPLFVQQLESIRFLN